MKVIAFSGRKQSGKTSLSNYLIDNSSKLFGNEIFHPVMVYGETIGYYKKFSPVKIQKFSFADKLKRFCIEYLGLDEKLCYGTDTDKETLTKYLWEDLPHYKDKLEEWKENKEYIKTGLMTYREVLQEYGTGFFRKINNNYHVEELKKTLDKSDVDVALIDDVRFENEVNMITKELKGTVIRLTRGESPDNHKSEHELNNFKFSNILDNNMLSLEQSQKELVRLLLNNGECNEI